MSNTLRKNKRQPGPLLFDQEQLKSVLIYEPKTGKLKWRSNGKIAGFHKKGKYSEVTYQRHVYAVRPLIWFYMTNERVPEGMHIKSLDGTLSNNKWSNLTLADKSQFGVPPKVEIGPTKQCSGV